MIDSHMHLSKDGVDDSWSDEFRKHVSTTLGLMDQSGIELGIVAHGLPAETLDRAVTEHDSRFKGLLHVYGQNLAEGIEDIEQFGDNPNIIGIKIYPNSFVGSDYRSVIGPVIERIKSKPWIIQVHSSPVTDSDLGIPLQTALFAHEVELPVVMVHSGGPQFLQLSVWLKHGIPDNLYFDTSATQNVFANSTYAPHFKWLLDLVPEDRLLWGSDYPEFSFDDALMAFQSLGFSETDLSRIAWENPLRFLREHTRTSLPMET